MTKQVSVALIGNMNNNFFSFTRYLRDEGYDAQLFLLNNEQSHFLPQNDALDDDWKSYTNQLTWGDDKSFKKFDTSAIRKQFSRYNLIVACGSAPAFLQKAGVVVDIFIPYGSDLYSLPFYNLVRPHNMLTMMRRAYWQKRGIAKARHIFMSPTGGKLEPYVQKLGFRGTIHPYGVPMLYWKTYYGELFEKFKSTSALYELINDLKKKDNLVLIHPCRHNWKKVPARWHSSGNDLLYLAVAELKICRPDLRIAVITFEYGGDVEETKKLIGELGIEDAVYWQPKSKRLEIMAAMQASDLVVGELQGGFLTYGVVYEAMVARKIIMHSCVAANFKSDFPSVYPMIFADSVESVSNNLEAVSADRAALAEMGNGSFQWFQQHLVDQPLQIVKQLTIK